MSVKPTDRHQSIPLSVPKVTAPQNHNWLKKTSAIAGLSAVILAGAALYCYKSDCFSAPKITEPSPAIPGPLGNWLPGPVHELVSWFDFRIIDTKFSHLINVGLYGASCGAGMSLSVLSLLCIIPRSLRNRIMQ